MATLILTTVAAVATQGMSLWVQAAAQAAAAVAGSYIDTSLFAPRIHNSGPRLSDLTLQVSSYGQPIPRVFGAENRIAGNVIWSSGLRETATKQKQGGKGGGGSVTTTNYAYDVDCAIALCQGPIKGVGRIWADGKLFRDAAGVQKQAHALRIYLGDEAQTADPAMQAALGVNATPAFRGTAYVFFEKLALADFGNRLPVFTFEVICDLATVETIATDLCLASGLAAGEFDAGGVEAHDVRGFVIGQPSSARGAFEPLRQAFFFDVSEREGRLTFFRSDRSADFKVPLGHLAAHDHGAARPRNYLFTRVSALEQPREIVVQHTDPARDYQPNAQRARRSTGVTQSDVSIDLPITLDVAAGKAIAERMMAQALARKDSATISLPTRYLFTEPGDKIVVPFDDGRDRTLRIESKTDFLPGRVELQGVQDGSAVLNKSAIAGQPAVPAQAVNPPGPAFYELMDLPLLRDEDDDPGFYAAAASWRTGYIGAVLYRSTDAGATYDRYVALPSIATFGTAVLGLSAAASPYYWDETSAVDVTLLRTTDELDSVTEAQILGGANACLIGDEVLQFRIATLTAPGEYTLRGLLRGRKGTEDQIALAVPNRRFVLLNGASIVRATGALSDVGLSRKFKAVSVGTALADAVAADFTNTGRAMKPLAPAHLAGYRAAGPGADLEIAWVRRSRLDATWRDLVDAPIGEERELYQTDILNGVTVVRTVETSAPGFTYTAAQQTADFGAPPATVTLNVYQISARVGRGFPTTGVL